MPIGHVEESVPSQVVASHILVYADSADHRLKALDAQGNKHLLSRYSVGENYLINGGFDLAQRQAPGTLTTYSTLTTTRKYAADRWALNGENDSLQWARRDTITSPETGLTARFAGRLLKITNAGKATMVQIVEGTSTAPLRGRRVRVSFKMKRITATPITMRLGLLALGSGGTVDTVPSTLYTDLTTAAGTDPTLGANVTQLTPQKTESTGTITGNGVDCVLTTAWQRFSATFDVPSTCLNLIVAVWSNDNLAVNDEVNFGEAGLYDGEEIMDWTPRPMSQEVAMAQRFYCKTFNLDIAPAASVGAASGEMRWPCTVGATTAQPAAQTWEFPVTMRAAPATLTGFNPGAAGAQARNITDGVDCTATAITANGEKRCFVAWTTGAGAAVSEIIGLHITAEAEL